MQALQVPCPRLPAGIPSDGAPDEVNGGIGGGSRNHIRTGIDGAATDVSSQGERDRTKV